MFKNKMFRVMELVFRVEARKKRGGSVEEVETL